MSGEYVCTLDQKSVKKAKDELNEIPEDRLAAVQSFRDWIKSQPHIRCPKTDTVFLLRFLRWSKFSQVRAREKFEHYLDQRKSNPKVFPDLDPSETAFITLAKTGIAFPLPNYDDNGCMVLFSTFNKDAMQLLNKYGILYMYRAFTILMEYVATVENTQVNGIVFFSDCTEFGPSIMTKFMTPEVGKAEEEFWKATPGRFKKFHMYNMGVVFDTLMAFFKPFIPKKIMSRMASHDSMASAFEQIPKRCFPREYLPDDYKGPSSGSMDECIDKYIKGVQEKDFIKDMKFISSDAFGVDFSKKPTEQVTQHFRKLNVD